MQLFLSTAGMESIGDILSDSVTATTHVADMTRLLPVASDSGILMGSPDRLRYLFFLLKLIIENDNTVQCDMGGIYPQLIAFKSVITVFYSLQFYSNCKMGFNFSQNFD